MKHIRILLSLTVASMVFAGFARADDKKPAGEKAKCCANAEADHKASTHGCCAEAAKAGKNCEKCGGTNEKKT